MIVLQRQAAAACKLNLCADIPMELWASLPGYQGPSFGWTLGTIWHIVGSVTVDRWPVLIASAGLRPGKLARALGMEGRKVGDNSGARLRVQCSVAALQHLQPARRHEKYLLGRAPPPLHGCQGISDKTRHKMVVVVTLLVIFSQRCMRSRLELGRS